MCSETSPRISFSNHLTQEQQQEQQEEVDKPTRRDTKLLESTSDFEFCVCSHESCSADDVFADGMILPLQFIPPSNQTHKLQSSTKISLPPLPSKKEIRVSSSDSEEKENRPKSFWGFKRSSSLNCDIKKSLICSLPLLSRSNSTGSVPNPKQKATSCKDISKQNSQKQQIGKKLSVSTPNYVYTLPQKPPLKNYYGGSHGNGVKISPVLNVNLFGFGSFLRNGKEKSRR